MLSEEVGARFLMHESGTRGPWHQEHPHGSHPRTPPLVPYNSWDPPRPDSLWAECSEQQCFVWPCCPPSCPWCSAHSSTSSSSPSVWTHISPPHTRGHKVDPVGPNCALFALNMVKDDILMGKLEKSLAVKTDPQGFTWSPSKSNGSDLRVFHILEGKWGVHSICYIFIGV